MTMSTRFRWMTTAVLALLFSVSASALAQNATITGKIVSDAGTALYGANVAYFPHFSVMISAQSSAPVR